MNAILRTSLATTFAAVCSAGATIAFAADNGNSGGNGTNAANNNDAGDTNSKSNKCADDNNATNADANCTTEPSAEQQ